VGDPYGPPRRHRVADLELIEMHPDRFLNKPLPTQGETLLVSPYVQPVIMVDPGTFGLPGSGPVMRPLVNTDGEVKEENSDNILTSTNAVSSGVIAVSRYVSMTPWHYTADGDQVPITGAAQDILPIPLTEAVADGAGAVTAITIIAADATRTHDIMIYLQASITGNYTIDWAEDPGGGGEAATIPDYHTAPIPLTMVAGQRYGPFHIMGNGDNLAMGWATMPNGSWPNGAQMVVYGDRRRM